MPVAVTNQDRDVSEVEITVATQNMKGLPLAKNLKRRTETFLFEVNDVYVPAPDLVGVEEAFVPGIRCRLKKSAGHPYFAMPKMTGIHLMNSGLAALSRYPIICQKFVPFKESRDTDALVSKGVLLTRVRHPVLGEVDFYMTHMQAAYKDVHQYDDARLAQAGQIAALMACESGDRTIIAVGDFNMIDDSAAYLYLTTDPLGPQLVDTMRTLHPGADLDTWRPENPDIKDTDTSQRIDYVFVRAGKGWEWDPQESVGGVTRPCGAENEEACIDSPNVSDHAGILETLNFKRTD